MKTITTALTLLLAVAPTVHAQQNKARPLAGTDRIRFEASYEAIESGKWTGKRLADGQPDVEGHWSNTVANHNNWTDPQGGIPGDPAPPRKPLGPRAERAPSRVTDPADGQVPFQPWAKAAQENFLKNFHNPTEPQYIEPLARCAPAGVPKSFIWHGYEIRQFPGYVVFLFNSGTRIIHLDGKPHLPANIKLWNADSRGHWEGNTLVVDVTNNNSKALFGRTGEFASENVRITERYIFSNDGKRYNYVATFDDPTVYTRPWTATIPAKRRTEKDAVDGWHYEVATNLAGKQQVIERDERICTENNIGFGHVAVTPPPR
ncbi:hypothetical protein [Duganella qianjiadongensis]|uniref:Uncharacterized protein n=1 Tax=Duganella qianjiadongensis TaxID=2692176 RepID=A0ABW9VEA5_9BURK|nr:hypothetical protein [Duganella qianjiadongensis]MYM37949.1 hypothetical protein [Duganella qianjiadongensis]